MINTLLSFINPQKKVSRLMTILKMQFPGNFSVSMDTYIPTLSNNGMVINYNYAEVDRFTAKYGTIASILVRKDLDFYRISTTIKNSNNVRAIDTKIDHSHPAYKALLSRNSYLGYAQLFEK
jgi:methyl-accepting chemotaxis protein-2 (aspartate sensor receptor)